MATDTTRPVPPELWPIGKWTTNPRVTMATTLGDVVYELQPNSATYSVVNFLAYVNTGFYKNLLFHRVVPGFVVQGGGFAHGLVHKSPFYDPIGLESNNGLSNLRGTLAMARTSSPDSATSQFFVNLAKNTNLNYTDANNPGYAVFGKVVLGMSVIDKIAKVATTTVSSQENVPVKDVVIKSAVETTIGTVYDKTGVVSVGGIESGARWQYSTDSGGHWTTGKSTGTGSFTFTLAAGAYEANDILTRQIDKAGNISLSGHTGASVVVSSATPILGDALANTLHGTSGKDLIFGLAGNDTLLGGTGADTLHGGSGGDILDGGTGKDIMIGGLGNDLYSVRDLTDVVRETSASGGIDTVKSFVSHYTLGTNVEIGQIMLTGSANLTGNSLDNTLFAGVGNNTLNGGDGTDTVSYAFGVSGSNGVDVSLATTSAQATGGSGSDTLIAIENLIGTSFADHLTGNSANNVLSGGAGADTLTGGEGQDILSGGAGNDVFHFDALIEMGSTLATADTITDFTPGTNMTLGDLLDLSTLDADMTTPLVNDAFSGVFVTSFSAAGQLKFDSGALYGNTDGDLTTVEFVIQLTGVTGLTGTDVIL